jgi:hypothetical protein
MTRPADSVASAADLLEDFARRKRVDQPILENDED